MPSQQSLWADNGCDLGEYSATQRLCLCRQSPTLIVGESDSPSTKMLSQNTILFDEIVDGVLLVLIDPSREGDQQELEWVQARSHQRSLSSADPFMPKLNSERRMNPRFLSLVLLISIGLCGCAKRVAVLPVQF